MKASQYTEWIKRSNLQTLSFCLIALMLPWQIKFISISIIIAIVLSLSDITLFSKDTNNNKPIFWITSLYFLLHIAWWIFQSKCSMNNWFEVEKKLSLFFLSLIFFHKKVNLNPYTIRMVFNTFIASLLLAITVCLSIATYRFVMSGDYSNFFYHQLVKPIGQHAVYLSAQILVAIIYLLFNYQSQQHKMRTALLIVVFSIAILLLSSKLIIVLNILLMLFITMSNYTQLKTKGNRIVIYLTLAVLTAVSLTHIRDRFTELSLNKLSLIKEHQSNASLYFDGLSLRLLQIKMGVQIVSENNAWLIGVGTNNAQTLLNQKYLDLGLYSGKDGKSGYLGLNFHNQYMETFVRFGFIGLTLLISLIALIFIQGVKNQSPVLLCVIILFSLFFLTESVLETTRGLVTFLFFSLLLSVSNTFIKPKHING